LVQDFIEIILRVSPIQKDDPSNHDQEDEAVKDLHLLPQCVKGHSRVQSEFETLRWLGKGGFGDVLKVWCLVIE
jgi:hypothetical protein